jgi:hypothetical protein
VSGKRFRAWKNRALHSYRLLAVNNNSGGPFFMGFEVDVLFKNCRIMLCFSASEGLILIGSERDIISTFLFHKSWCITRGRGYELYRT